MNPAHIVNEALQELIPQLFLDHGAELRVSEDFTGSLDLLGVIGFSSAGLRGSVGLACSPDFIARSAAYSIGLDDVSEVDHELTIDWLGELVNMLLGRLKLTLKEHEIDIALAVPIVLSALNIQSARVQARGGQIGFLSEAGEGVWVCFDLYHDEDFALSCTA